MSDTHGWRALDERQVQELATELIAAAPRVLRSASPDSALATFGWIPREQEADDLLVADVPFPVSAPAVLAIDGDRVRRVTAPISDVVLGVGPEPTAFRQDAFAAAAAALRAAYGEPARREPGEWPQIDWEVADVTLRLNAGPAMVTLAVVRTAVARELEQAAADDAEFDADLGS